VGGGESFAATEERDLRHQKEESGPVLRRLAAELQRKKWTIELMA